MKVSMKSTKVKVILGVLVLMIIVMIAGVVIIKQKISPEEIKKIAKIQLETTFPGAQVELGNVDYRLGPSLKFNVDKMNLFLKDPENAFGANEKGLFQVKGVVVKIPIWALITQGGTVDVVVDNPEVGYFKNKDQSNWDLAMGGRTKGEEAATPEESPKKREQINIPTFLSRIELNVKFTNVKATYRIEKAQDGEVLINRFVLKNLNFKKSSAFELDTTFKVHTNAQNHTEEIALNSLVVGQLNLHEFIKGNDLEGALVIQLKDIKLPQLPNKIDLIKTDLKFNLKVNQDLHLTVDTSMNETSKFSAKILKEKESIKFEQINVALNLANLLTLAGKNIENLNVGKAQLELTGSALVQTPKDQKPVITTDLQFKLSPEVVFNLDAAQKVTISATGRFAQEKLTFDLKNKLLSGEVNVKGDMKVDLSDKTGAHGKPANPMDKLGPISIDILAHNLNIPQTLIKEKLYKKKTPGATEQPAGTDTEEEAKVPKVANSAPPQIPQTRIHFKMIGVKVADQDVSSEGHMTAAGNKISSKDLSFKYGQGEGKVNFDTTLLKGGQSSRFDFQVARLNLDAFRAFLPPIVDNISGTMEGKVNGDVQTQGAGKPTHNVAVNVTVKNGTFKGINISEQIAGVVGGLPLLKDQLNGQELKVSEKFDLMELQGQFKQDNYQFSKITYLGINKNFEIQGTGTLYPLSTTQTGQMDLTFKDRDPKRNEKLIKNIGTDTIPIRLTGYQFSLKPDIGYTLEKVATSAAKTRGKEELKKVAEKQLEKVGEKLLKGKGEDIKNMFKGIFK